MINGPRKRSDTSATMCARAIVLPARVSRRGPPSMDARAPRARHIPRDVDRDRDLEAWRQRRRRRSGRRRMSRILGAHGIRNRRRLLCVDLGSEDIETRRSRRLRPLSEIIEPRHGSQSLAARADRALRCNRRIHARRAGCVVDHASAVRPAEMVRDSRVGHRPVRARGTGAAGHRFSLEAGS